MRSKAIYMALLALAVGSVEAVPVTREQATAAVRKWVRSGHHLGMRHGTEVEKATALKTDAGKTFYAVKLKGRGTVFTSSDTDSEPIVAFTSSTEDFSNIDKKSPLWALLSRDAEVRANIRAYRAAVAATNRLARAKAQASAAATGATSVTASAEPATAASRRWARLLAAEAVADPTATGASAPRIEDESEINDVRRSPLVETRWSQTTHDDAPPEGFEYYVKTEEGTFVLRTGTGIDCYNYYTPTTWFNAYYTDEEGNWNYFEEPAPCGCTATATAQVMRYFKYPTDPLPPAYFTCEMEDEETGLLYEDDLQTRGGTYDWANMIAAPKNGVTNTQAEAIGHLTYDVGVALGSSYTSGNTSAYPYDIPEVLTGYFGYQNAVCLWAESLINEANAGEKPTGRITSNIGLHNPIVRRNVVYTNLDHSNPVIFGIYGYSAGHVGDYKYWAGHAVVGDGYGFLVAKDDEGKVTNSVEYVHINMGWSGSDDAWYNIPEIDAVETGATGADTGFNFTVMAAAIYNIFTNETGEIVSGRVLKDGEPVPGVTVTAGNLSAVTDDKGIYSLVVPSASNCVLTAFWEGDNFEGSAKANVKTSAYTLRVGNVWGADITLEPSPYADSVRNRSTGITYGSVDAAYAAASAGAVIEVLAPTRIRSESFVFAKDLTLVAVNGEPAEDPINLRIGADISVAGSCLTLTNVAFKGGTYQALSNMFSHTIITHGGVTNEVVEIPVGQYDTRYYTNVTVTAAMNPIRVAAGAKLSVSGRLVLPELSFADTDGFVLGGEIYDNLKLQVPSFARGEKVGTATCDAVTATNCAQFIVNPDDRFLTALPSPYPTLKWELAHIEDKDLVATLKIAGNEQSYRYSDLDRLLQDVGENDAEITVYRNCTLTKPLPVVGRNLKIAGVGDILPKVENIGSSAGFSVGASASLCISNICFSNYRGNALFMVNGEGAQLTLEKGSILDSLKGTNSWSGAVTVRKGTVTMLPGSAIVDCAAIGAGQKVGKGGAVYLDGTNCVLNLFGGTIKGCLAKADGGGVFAARLSVINLKGFDIDVSGNTSGAGVPDDVHVDMTASYRAHLKVVGGLADGDEGSCSHIGVRYTVAKNNTAGFGDKEGRFFAEIDGSCGASEVPASARAFFSDADVAGLKAAYDENVSAENLFWEAVPVQDGPRTKPDPSRDVARIVRCADLTNFFYSVSDAFAAVDAEGLTLELLKDASFNADIVLSNKVVTLCRAPEAPAVVLRRMADCSIILSTGAELTVTNLQIKGPGKEVSKMLLNVSGGALTLLEGAVISNVEGADSRAASAVVVSMGGMFTMEDGAVIRDCCNSFIDVGNAVAVGAGLLVDKGTAYLNGGTVTGCSAYRSGGVSVSNGGHLYVKGGVRIVGNTTLSGADSDLTVEDLGGLYLVNELTATASIGVDKGIFTDTNVFGRVDASYAEPVSNLVSSAARFFRDADHGDKGLIFTNATDALLVWSSAAAVDAEGRTYYKDAKTRRCYYLVDVPTPEPEFADPTPIAFQSITRSAETEWELVVTDRVQWAEYRLIWTDDLTKGFTTTGAWEQATTGGPWTTNVLFAAPAPTAIFWKAEGQRGTVQKD